MAARKVSDIEIIRILADPDTKSIKDAAEKLGLAPQSLYERLENNPELWDSVKAAVHSALKTEIGPIWQALVKAAKRGDIAAADRVLKRAGEYDEADPTDRTVNINLADGLSKEDIERIAKSILTEDGEDE